MELLRLAALDTRDLQVMSAHIQDAVLKVGDMKWLPAENRFILSMNRFNWETATGRNKQEFERRRSVLHFDRVQSVRARRIRQDAPDAVLELLTAQYEEQTVPAGIISLVFAGGGVVELQVECIEAQLSDLGAAWSTESKPEHDLEDVAEAVDKPDNAPVDG